MWRQRTGQFLSAEAAERRTRGRDLISMTQTRDLAKPIATRRDVSPAQRTAVILMAQLVVIVALLVLRSMIRRRRQSA